MQIEVRACQDEQEVKEYLRISSYVFANNEEQGPVDEIVRPEWTTCAFVDGRMATTMGAFPFTVRLNGAPIPMGGVTSVGTLPQFRRRGLLRRVMRQGLETMRERNQPIAILWASMGAIYQRFGYGLASAQVTYSFDPRFAGFQHPRETSGSIDLLGPEDAYPIIKPVYIQAATPRNLFIHRAVPLWQAGVLRSRDKEKVHVAVYSDAQGDARGYAVYRTSQTPQEAPGPEQVLSVTDFITLDMDAYLALWEYIRGHDLVGRVNMSVGEDDPAPDLLLEPRMLNRRTSDGIWMRIVDIEEALPRRPYGDRGELTFAIPSDDMCPWNAGTYLLETDGRTTEVRRTDRSPDLTMTANTLASLVAGYRDATHYARAGRLEAANQDALVRANRMFATAYAPYCPDGF